MDFPSDARPTPFWSGVMVRKAREIQNNDVRRKNNKSDHYLSLGLRTIAEIPVFTIS